MPACVPDVRRQATPAVRLRMLGRLTPLLVPALLLLPEATAPRAPGPCSEWFDNAWLKSRGYSADVCCWRNHTDCWQDGHSYSSCCSDYDISRYEEVLASGSQPGDAAAVAAALAAIALPISGVPELDGTALDGKLAPELELPMPTYASPRDFFRATVPAARLAAQLAEASENTDASGSGLVLFFMTAPGNFARRHAIRKTWLQSALWQGAEGVRYIFVAAAPDATTRERIPNVKQELIEEQRQFSDLLVLQSLQDVYWGWEHTAKTFLALIAVLARAPTAVHFACLHDDVYVHVPRLVSLLASARADEEGGGGYGLYLGNAYLGHDFVGHSADDGPAYEAMHGHLKMPPIMKGGLWVVDRVVAQWVAATMSGPAAMLPWRLWPSDDDSVGLVFGELDLRRVHALRHGIEWFDWRLGDRCHGESLVVAHDLKTPRELFEMWAREMAFNDPCYGNDGGAIRLSSRPEDFVPSQD